MLKIVDLVAKIRNQHGLLRRNVAALINQKICKNATTTTKNNNDDDDDDYDKPIKYSTSEAAKLTAKQSLNPVPEYRPWYQGPVITLSLLVFMLYFFILREENDIDLMLDENLYDKVPNLRGPSNVVTKK